MIGVTSLPIKESQNPLETKAALRVGNQVRLIEDEHSVPIEHPIRIVSQEMSETLRSHDVNAWCR
jgi:hypothetical protein